MSQAELLSRLESVTQRLERVARKMGGGGGDEEGGVPQYVTDYAAFVNKEVKAAADATTAVGVAKVGDILMQGFGNVLELIKRAPNAKKPSMQELSAFMQPCSEAIGALDNLRYRAKDFKTKGDHYKAAFEMLNSLQWVFIVPPNGTPVGHLDAQLQATDFNLNRVLKNNKDDATKAMLAAYKALNAQQKALVKEYFPTGITWNPKGGALADASGATPAAAPEAKEEAKEAPKKAAGAKGAAGLGAVFGELNQGTAITKGLKKVKKSQKTKYRADRSGKVTAGPAKKKSRNKGTPRTIFAGGRWLMENYDEGIYDIDKADIKSTVFITTCDNAVVQVPNKVKSVVIDNCVKCRVFVTEVISTVEMVNCKSCQIIVRVKAPSLAIDKCSSPTIILTREAFNETPEIYTSNVSAMNVQIPGKTDDDDPVDIPIPEQFKTTISVETGEATTEEVTHG